MPHARSTDYLFSPPVTMPPFSITQANNSTPIKDDEAIKNNSSDDREAGSIEDGEASVPSDVDSPATIAAVETCVENHERAVGEDTCADSMDEEDSDEFFEAREALEDPQDRTEASFSGTVEAGSIEDGEASVPSDVDSFATIAAVGNDASASAEPVQRVETCVENREGAVGHDTCADSIDEEDSDEFFEARENCYAGRASDSRWPSGHDTVPAMRSRCLSPTVASRPTRPDASGGGVAGSAFSTPTRHQAETDQASRRSVGSGIGGRPARRLQANSPSVLRYRLKNLASRMRSRSSLCPSFGSAHEGLGSKPGAGDSSVQFHGSAAIENSRKRPQVKCAADEGRAGQIIQVSCAFAILSRGRT